MEISTLGITRNVSVFFCLIFSINFLYSQNIERDKKTDSLIYEIALNISSSDATKSHHLADSLFLYAPSDHYKIKALLLSTEIYKMEERTQNMLESLLHALELSKETQDYISQSKIYGYLASLSRETGFYEEGKHYLKKGIESIHKTKDPGAIGIYLAIANQEMAEFEIEMGNFRDAIHYLNLSSEYYRNQKENSRILYLLSRIEQIKGRSYMGLKNYDQALIEFHKSKSNLQKSKSENSLIWALLYQSLGNVYLTLNEKDSTHFYLSKALILAEPSNHNSFKEEIYSSLTQYFIQTKNADSMRVYDKKYRDLAQQNKQSKKISVNNLTQTLPSNKIFLKNSDVKFWWIAGTGILICGGIIFSAIPLIRNRFIKTDKKEKLEINFSVNTEKKINERLALFESSKKFLNPNINYAILVSFLDTNTRYVNEYLKTKLKKDFNTYINDLRINYIIEQINKNEEYRLYKISELAKESGFSSHSNFTANFKRVTGVAPSEYLQKKTE